MALATSIKEHWLAIYLCIGIAIFIYVLVTDGWPEQGFTVSSSSPAPKTGIYGLFWGCAAFWPIMLIGALLSEDVKRRLYAAGMMLSLIIMFLLPVVIVVRLLWLIFFT